MRNIRTVTAAVSLLALAGTACAPNTASSDAYPERAIELVVPFDAGGATDIAGRVLAEALSDELDVPVNVVNKPGADQITGVSYVHGASPDGYTLLADGAGSSSLQSLVPDMPFEWDDRTFISRAMVGPHAYAVGSDSEADSLEDVVAQAKQDPSEFSVAWLGGASTSDFALLQLLTLGGVDVNQIKRVPFESSGDAMIAAASGDVDLAVGGASATFSLHQSGDLRVLAITGDQPVEQLRDVPTAGDLGQPELDILYWVGITGPPGLPADVTAKLQDAIDTVSEDPALQKMIAGIAMRVDVLNGDDMKSFAAKEADVFGSLAEQLGNQR